MIKIKVVDCVRCGGVHDAMQFVDLTIPTDGWSHWGLCPTNGEPVMVKVGGGVHARPEKAMQIDGSQPVGSSEHRQPNSEDLQPNSEDRQPIADSREPLHRLPVMACPRCHESHGELDFFALDNAPDGYDAYATCPKTGQPIMADIARLTSPVKNLTPPNKQ